MDRIRDMMVEEYASMRGKSTYDPGRFVSTLISNLPGFVYRCCNDADWTMEFIGGTVENVTGYPPEALLHNRERSFASIIHPEDRVRVRDDVESALERDAHFQVEYRVVRPSGEEAWVWARGRGVFDRDGALLALEGFVFDITERRRAMDELEARKRELHQAQKMEALGLLAGGLAHDLNNIFTTVKGFCELVRDGVGVDEETAEYFQEIRDSIDRGAHLVKQIAALGKRNDALEVRTTDLNRVVLRVGDLLSRVLMDNIDLELDLEDGLWPVRVDPSQVDQMLLNLGINAQDAMPRGGELGIKTRNVELEEEYTDRKVEIAPGRYVVLSVEDTGTGMEPEIRDRVFEPFFTTKEDGTGLGLSTTYGIVHQWDGHIFVYSEPGEGTIFKVYLPRSEEVTEEAAPPPDREADRAVDGHERILVVEDEEPIRRLLETVLTRHGYEVVGAGSGEEALRLLEDPDLEIDLVYTDLVLPGMSGQNLIHELTERGVTDRAICSSGYSGGRARGSHAIDADTVFLPKPYTPGLLLGTIRDVLGA